MFEADHSTTTTTPDTGEELAAIGREIAPKIDEVRARAEEWFAIPDDQRVEKADSVDTMIHHDRLWELWDRAVTLTVGSLDGVRTKLLLARWQLEIEHWRNGVMDTESMSPTERMAWSLCNDLLGATCAAHVPLTADAELIAACAEFDRLEHGYLRLYYGPTRLTTDEERDAADEASGRVERQGELVRIIYDTRATTLEGWRAKARSAATWDVELLRSESGNESEIILASLVRDLVGDHDPVAIVEAKQVA